ncbi:MAG: tRNA (adenosine(37)-N6)-threonylcarbamoyltransferase complex ATPase subunit type 1 TsaE [Gammaproteobacteria bacterium]|nr:tRNA (adenosine(37)-N6)-threonylcarbamoyltransferase complex ATPase subunit type 1 TsaE [Gammaproteobacteria bacterium]
MTTRTLNLDDEADTCALAAHLASRVQAGSVITLRGPLAAGKTSFARGFLRGLGFTGTVKSPTFTLVETYRVADFTVHHFDLYRLVDPGELYYLGFDEYLLPGTIALIEWPERGGEFVPIPDLEITLEVLSATQRHARLIAATFRGEALIEELGDSKKFS